MRLCATGHGDLVFGGRCQIMGILNLTPDSFSDGGRFASVKDAVSAACSMAAEGADVIDVGGESTRPGAKPVPADEQIKRVIPFIRAARDGGLGLPISIDTQSAAVAEAALEAGADLVNDISGARADTGMPALLAERRVPFVIMHMQGKPATMQQAVHYDDVVVEVERFFLARAEALASAGVDVDLMIIDPGIGFGKKLEHNLELLRSAHSLGVRWPVVVGPSRKSFLGQILGVEDPAERLMGTAAAVAHSVFVGVDMVRVHDIRKMRQVVDTCYALVNGQAALAPYRAPR